jgi:hypothetical protein
MLSLLGKLMKEYVQRTTNVTESYCVLDKITVQSL